MRQLNKTLLLFLLLTTMGCDQMTKHVARSIFPNKERRITSIGILHFRYAENSGGLLGIGEDLPEAARFWTLTVAAAAGLLLMLVFLLRQSPIPIIQALGLVCMAGGGASNLIDRIVNDGRVVDFMILRVGELQTGVFNLADVVIVIGFVLVAISLIIPGRLSRTGPATPLQ